MVRFLLFFSVVLFHCSFSFGAQFPENDSDTMSELLLFYDEEELFSASFFDTTSRKAPGYSYIINEKQINESPGRTLSDIIEMKVPGMTTGGHDRNGPIIGTRGIFIDNNAKTLVMLDEQQINQRGHFGYAAGLLSPLLGDLKTIEVILGPGAILHGSGAINGFINMIPKSGEEYPGLFFNSEYGFAEELWKFETGYGASYGEKKNFYFYGGVYGADGYEPDELYGFSKTFDINSNGFEDLNYRFSIHWNHENFTLNTFFYENNPYKKNSFEIGHFKQAALGISPRYVYKINTTDSFEFIGSVLWFDHRSPGRPAPPAVGVIPDRGGSEYHWELKNIYRTKRWDRNSLALGFLYGEKSFYQKDQFFSDDAETWLGTLDTKWKEVSIFTEDVVAFSDSWTASFGLRYDRIYLENMSAMTWTENKQPDEIEGHFSPRIATAYEFDANTIVKASFQHGFRTPDAFYYLNYLTFKDAAEAIGLNFPSLDIETMDSYELNLQKNLPAQKVKMNCNLFYNIFKDLLRWKFYEDTELFTQAELDAIKAFLGLPPPVRPGSILNAQEKIKAYGGEINATAQLLPHTKVSLSYGYVQLDNEKLMQYPKHQIKVNTMSSFWEDKLRFSLDYLYNNGYSKTDLPVAHDIYREDRHVVNMAINYNIIPKATLNLTINNLFENDIPPIVFEANSPSRGGGLGFDERRIYISLMLKI